VAAARHAGEVDQGEGGEDGKRWRKLEKLWRMHEKGERQTRVQP
jgi:hypothetical protein